MTRFERVMRRRRQLHLPPFDVHYRRPLIGALGSKLVGVGPRLFNERFSDWLPPMLSRRLGRATLRLGDGLLARSRPLYSFDRQTWYASREWARRFETEHLAEAVTEEVAMARQAEYEGAGEALARAEGLAASIGWRVTHLGRHSPQGEPTWEATARQMGPDTTSHKHGEGARARDALDELIDGLRLEQEVQP